MSEIDVREKAEWMAARSSVEGAALAYANLDLADALREVGEKIAMSLADIQADISQLAIAVDRLSFPDRV